MASCDLSRSQDFLRETSFRSLSSGVAAALRRSPLFLMQHTSTASDFSLLAMSMTRWISRSRQMLISHIPFTRPGIVASTRSRRMSLQGDTTQQRKRQKVEKTRIPKERAEAFAWPAWRHCPNKCSRITKLHQHTQNYIQKWRAASDKSAATPRPIPAVPALPATSPLKFLEPSSRTASILSLTPLSTEPAKSIPEELPTPPAIRSIANEQH